VNTAGGNIAGVRAAVEELHAKFPPPAEVAVKAANAGGVPALRCSPPDPAGAPVLFLHGGGHIAGRPSATATWPARWRWSRAARSWSRNTGWRPSTRSPHRWTTRGRPYRSLLDEGTRPTRIAVAGDSSGGGLVLSLLLALRDEGLPLPGRAVLHVPVDRPRRRHPQAACGRLTADRRADATAQFADLYLAGHPADDPLVVPLRADLSGLPAAADPGRHRRRPGQ
jgi:acetyl esterase/lipase